MIGRQVIEVNKNFTLEELEEFMQNHWDAQQYNSFVVDKPTPLSVEKYILLPATPRFTVAVYPRGAGKLFGKENKVILIVCDTPKGAVERLSTSLGNKNILKGAWSISTNMSIEKERKGPAEDILLKYTEYMKNLLASEGYIK